MHVQKDFVTPFAGVWIEIMLLPGDGNAVVSLPSRECGLKLDDDMIAGTGELSLPSRECGLKSFPSDCIHLDFFVTPFAGVWIEIRRDFRIIGSIKSLPSRECGGICGGRAAGRCR